MAIWFVLLPVYIYQYCISPFLPANCRFIPSCSEYTKQAIIAHGIFKGGILGIKRLMRCQPFGGCGYDPVPPKQPHTKNNAGAASCATTHHTH